MKKIILTGMVALMAATSLAACSEQNGGFSREDVGSLIGAGTGAFLGSRIGKGGGRVVGGIAGALVGAWAGKQVVKGLNADDRRYYDEAATRAEAAPTGQAVTWYNPQSGAQGSITPVRVGETNMGYCREYQQTITVGGQTQRAYGTACRQPDGSWKIVSTSDAQ